MRLLRTIETRRLNPKLVRSPSFKNETQRAAHRAVLEAMKNGQLEQVEVDCPVCQSASYEHVASIDRQSLPVVTVRCLGCPTLYSRRRFTEEALTLFYSSFYRNLYSGASRPSQPWFNSQVESGQKILSTLISAKAIPSRLDGYRVLEVGSGAGGVLVPFLESGASVLGIDFDHEYMEFGRSQGVDLQTGGISNLQSFGSQDLVILKDVLEHLPDPVASLKLVLSVLSMRGIVYIQVPGLQTLRFLGYRDDLLRYLQIAHLCHYTQESLEYVCRLAGFKVTHSQRRGVVVCVKGSDGGVAPLMEHPSPEHAKVALEKIYSTRAKSAVRFAVSSRIPARSKILLRSLLR